MSTTVVRTAALAAALLCAACGAAAMNHLMADDFVGKFKVMGTADAPFLASEKGMTLYTFAKDVDGKPTCVGACAQQWPPVLVIAGDMAIAPFSFVARDDGTRQWAIENQPLYLFVRDTEPGQTNGREVEGWATVKVAAHEM
jgi:predicted lipoprotein with Yx(FWY)xxD motif